MNLMNIACDSIVNDNNKWKCERASERKKGTNEREKSTAIIAFFWTTEKGIEK